MSDVITDTNPISTDIEQIQASFTTNKYDPTPIDEWGLTERNKAFAAIYLTKDYFKNATKAYMVVYPDATYDSARALATNLLANVNMQKYIAHLETERNKRTDIDQTMVLEGLREVAMRCMQAEPVMVRQKGSQEMVHAVDSETGRGLYTFNANGANRSLELLGKHLGLFKEQIEVTDNRNPVIDVNVEQAKPDHLLDMMLGKDVPALESKQSGSDQGGEE